MTLDGISEVAEERESGMPPIWTHPDWRLRFPWLTQGVTSAGEGSDPFDLGLFGDQRVGAVMDRWSALREHLGVPAAVHARQVHGARVLSHTGKAFAGTLVLDSADAHTTRVPGLLLTVSVADCVPVLIVDEQKRAVAAVHAGWRGVAANILKRAVDTLRATHESFAPDLWLHCGPAICGGCYEVGPEVHRAVWSEREAPAAARPIDLREALAWRALQAGIRPERVSVSSHCTLCGSGGFFSHRGGSRGRQMAFIGIRREGSGG